MRIVLPTESFVLDSSQKTFFSPTVEILVFWTLGPPTLRGYLPICAHPMTMFDEKEVTEALSRITPAT